MPIELKMPALSPTMEKGTLAKWLVAVGDKVEPGDLLAEIETDKATMEFEAIDQGVIAAILVTEGTEEVSVGAIIALLSQEGEAAAPEPTPVAEVPAKSEVPPAATPEAPPAPAEPPAASAPVAVAVAPIAEDMARVNATPLAQRIAAAENISLAGITGHGPRGRIMKADLGLAPLVPAVAPDRAPAAPVPAIAVHGPPSDIPFEAFKLSSMRKTIARRLSESKQTVPHFYLTSHIRIDDLLRFRSELNASLSDRATRISVNDFIVKATAQAMAIEPDVNVQFAGDQIYRFGRVDISMAVAIEGGLVTPVIRDVTSLSLSSIAGQSKRLAGLARDGKLLPEDYRGGTASVSNLGMFGIDEIIPVINPPQGLIVGVGSGIEKPWNVGGTIGLATVMTTTVSFDHRAIDGAAGARFMAVLREHIERPLLLVA